MLRSLSYYEKSSGSVFYRATKKELILFLFSAFLFLLGCYRMSVAGLPELGENVSSFLVGAVLASVGFFLSWFNGKRWMWLMIGVAVVGRLLFLPLPASEDLVRRMWEGEVLDSNFNPYQVTPGAQELELLRGDAWERIRDKDEVSSQPPLILAIFRLLYGMGFNEWGIKTILVVVDIWICIILAMRYGSRKAALYGWNPLVAFSVAGEGHMESLMLLPALGGFLIWEAWVDRKGGAVIISTNGGLSGGPGQMVSFAALLMGLAAAMNLVFLPIVIWMFWHVLVKSGIKTGIAILLVGLIPLLAFNGWGSVSLNTDLKMISPFSASVFADTLSLVPGTLSRIGVGLSPEFFFWLVVVISLLLVFRNSSMERFANLYIGTYLVLAVAVYPSSFLWMAPFALGTMHLGFRLVSLSAFIYYASYLGGEGPVALGSWYSVALWIPFLIGILWYALTCRSKSSGFYVRSY